MASQPSSLQAYWLWWYWSLLVIVSCHEIETRMESFLELCGKVVKIRLGSFMELQLGNVFRLIKVWNFLCVFIVYELLETNLNFFTRSTINLLFLDWGTGLKSAYIKVSVVFRKCIQTRFDQLDIVIILQGTRFLKCSLQAVNSTLQFFT